MNQIRFERHNLLRHLNNDICTVFSTKASQKSSHDDNSLPNVVQSVSFEKKSPPSTLQDEKNILARNDCHSRAVFVEQRRVYRHVETILVNMGNGSRLDVNHQAPSRS